MTHKILRLYFKEEHRTEIQRFVNIFVKKFDKEELRIVIRTVDNESSAEAKESMYHKVINVEKGWISAIITNYADGTIDSLKGRIEEIFFVELFIKIKEILKHRLVEDYDFIVPKYREVVRQWFIRNKRPLVEGLQIVLNESKQKILGVTLTLQGDPSETINSEDIFLENAVKNVLFKINKSERFFVVYEIIYGSEENKSIIYAVHTFKNRYFIEHEVIYYSDLNICILAHKIDLFQKFMFCLLQRFSQTLLDSKDIITNLQKLLQTMKG